jgi:hypothetical protein
VKILDTMHGTTPTAAELRSVPAAPPPPAATTITAREAR